MTPTQGRIDAGALSLGFLAYGSTDRQPIVMFHGLSDSAWSLHPLAEALAKDYQVFSFDLRGHGLSDWGAYTLHHLVGDIRGVVEALELVDPIVIGHSLGGQAASQFCGLYPDLPRALVLIEALGPPPNRRRRTEPIKFQLEYDRNLVETVRRPARSRPHASIDAAVDRFRDAHPLLDPAHARLIVEKGTKEMADGSVEWRFDPETKDWLAGHDHERAEQRWQGVTCPTFVVQGGDAWERFWQTRMIMSEDLEGPISDAELNRRLGLFSEVEHVVVEGAGHMVHYDKPEELIQLVGDFVKRVCNEQ